MAMGTRRKRERQQDLWIATSDVVETPANVFYDRLNQILDEHKFDAKVERLCRKFYKQSPYGRPSMAPGVYFRSLLIGYFEGLDSERGIAWRTADSLSLRKFLGYALDEATPEHSTISRTRRLYWSNYCLSGECPHCATRVSAALCGRSKGGRPPGQRMPCGWRCGAECTQNQMRAHFTNCPNRPTAVVD